MKHAIMMLLMLGCSSSAEPVPAAPDAGPECVCGAFRYDECPAWTDEVCTCDTPNPAKACSRFETTDGPPWVFCCVEGK